MTSSPVVSQPDPATAPVAPPAVMIPAEATALAASPDCVSCANCGARLPGKYCASCGQKHEPHVHSVLHFTHEAFESLTHADSRLWRTLWLLLARPGRLTREFFAGRRVSYLPPFRLYLVISLVFFLLVGPSDNFDAEIKVDADGKPGAELIIGGDEPAKQEKPATVPGDFTEGLRENNVITEFCKDFAAGSDPAEADRNYGRVQSFCRKSEQDRGKALIKAVVHSMPRAMFVFLPLLALFMKLMYWRPKRYYVEHLTFLVHNHAFVFLVLSIMALIDLIPGVRDHTGPLELAVWIYMSWYLYRGMRNYYGQGRALTLSKYFIIGVCYLSAGASVLLITAIFTVAFF